MEFMRLFDEDSNSSSLYQRPRVLFVKILEIDGTGHINRFR